MSVYKEGFYIVELIQKNSKRIWPDACDYGALTKKGDELWNCVKQLFEWYGDDEKHRKLQKYGTGLTLTREVELIDEWSSQPKLITFKVTYTESASFKKLGYDGMFEVEEVKSENIGNPRWDD